jgi:hypothetical protein
MSDFRLILAFALAGLRGGAAVAVPCTTATDCTESQYCSDYTSSGGVHQVLCYPCVDAQRYARKAALPTRSDCCLLRPPILDTALIRKAALPTRSDCCLLRPPAPSPRRPPTPLCPSRLPSPATLKPYMHGLRGFCRRRLVRAVRRGGTLELAGRLRLHQLRVTRHVR